MSCGYDPFKWADNFESEEEYYMELMKDERKKENELSNDIRKRQTSDDGDAKRGTRG